MPQDNDDDRGHGQGQKHAQEAEQLTAGQHGENHRHRVPIRRPTSNGDNAAPSSACPRPNTSST